MKPGTIVSLLLSGALLFLCVPSRALANSINSNSIVKENIEYYLQTDKAVYEAGETVQILYRVTNLGSEAVTFRFTCGPVTDRCDFMVEKDGQRVWDNLGRPTTLALTSFTLDPSGSNSFAILWDMTDANDNQIAAGDYEVTAVLNSLYLSDDKYVPVSVTITITPTTILVPDDYPTIQQAIDVAVDGDTVIVADGTYTGEGNRDIDFLGKAFTLRSESGLENCIIDCNGNGRGFYFHNGEDANSVLDGFTITNGYSPTSGAILCLHSSPVIRNCNISGNRSEFDSGGICFENSSAIITNCTISNNSATEGGGISCFQSSVVITNCTISDNSAEDEGAGIYCYDGSPTIANCTVTGNRAEGRAGGIYCDNGNLFISKSTVSNNSAAACAGILCWQSTLTVADCTIASNNLGGISGVFSTGTITNSAILGNAALEYGAGCGFGASTVKIANSVIAGNWTLYAATPAGGAGLHFDENTIATVRNCTIADNSANGWFSLGGGILSERSDTNVTDCVVWKNAANFAPDIASLGTSSQFGELAVSFSDILGGQAAVYTDLYSTLNWGEGNIDADPCFVEPGYWADACDPNIIVEPNDASAIWVEGDYHLLRNSPCIDAGDPNYVPEPNETDLDSNPRVSGYAIDMGAYESLPAVEAAVKIRPRTLNLRSRGKWIMCVIRLPEDYNVADIDPNSILLEDEIPVDRVWLQEEFAVVKFSRTAVQEMLTEVETPAEVELVVSGERSDGTIFEGADTIRVINKGRRRNNLPGRAGRRVILKRK
jgi:parallel beta-helix repeat protein